MTNISPQQFKDAFLQVVIKCQQDLIDRWGARKDYTHFMRGTILPEVGPLLGIEVFSGDYYYLDCIYYTAKDTEHFGNPKTTYATSIGIALEHENDIGSTAIEMNKLQLFNAPLKVLVTYSQNESERTFHLERYNKILRAGDIFGDFATLRRHLVIFGSLHEPVVNWHFYVYESSGFKGLPAT